MRIDLHTHVVPVRWEDFAARYGGGRWPRLVTRDACRATIMTGEAVFREIDDRSWRPERRIEDMERLRIDRQALSPPPVMFCYWAEARAGQAFARMQNDHVAELVARHPQRFVGMATVPLQDLALAIEELRHARERLGLRAVEIGTCPGGSRRIRACRRSHATTRRRRVCPGLMPSFKRSAAVRRPSTRSSRPTGGRASGPPTSDLQGLLDAAAIGETMDVMRLIVSAVLVMMLAGLTPAAESGGLTGALERQRLDMATQQSEIRREIERQSGSLQRQQDRNLQFQLLQRNPPSLPPAVPNCAQVSDGFICR